MTEPKPRQILRLDLAAGAPPYGLNVEDGPIFLVVWWRDLLLGYDHVHRSLTAAELATRIAQLIRPSVQRRLARNGQTPPQPARTRSEPANVEAMLALREPLRALDELADEPEDERRVTLVICTANRPAALARCLSSIAQATVVAQEVLVVDNAPDAPATRAVLNRFPGFRYLPEPRRGLSAARNAAVRTAQGEVVAFVDDDVIVHPRWLAPLRRSFRDPEVMAATGLVLPAELETAAQIEFEFGFGGLSRGVEPVSYGRSFLRATVAEGMPVWRMGAGANMAIRRSAFDLVGEFDERLGPSGGPGCGDDSEFWYRLLAEGWECRYEPDSVVFHYHRRDAKDLQTQIRAYMRGHMAALFVQFARFRHVGNLRRALLSLPKHYTRRAPRVLARATAQRAGLAQRGRLDTYPWEVGGYLRGLSHLRLAASLQPPRHKARLGEFLGRNPFTHPYTLGFFYREKMRAIHRVAPDLPAREVLEIGGGRSGLARLLYPDAHVTTLDLDQQLAAAEVNRDPRVQFVVGDATDLPFDDSSFDVVTFFDVLEHIAADQRAVQEALRVLRPGGFVLVTTPSQRWRFPYHRRLRQICPTEREIMAEWGHVRRGYAPAELSRLFGWRPHKTAGFISPVTVLVHDIGWSKLPERMRRALCSALSPVAWAAYALHPSSRPGTEIAASWYKPEA